MVISLYETGKSILAALNYKREIKRIEMWGTPNPVFRRNVAPVYSLHQIRSVSGEVERDILAASNRNRCVGMVEIIALHQTTGAIQTWRVIRYSL